ncbi:MAG TPA: phosphotransferase [Candidatus Saccharimonadales bacterium]
MHTTKDKSIQAVADFFYLGPVAVLGRTPFGEANESYFVRANETSQQYVIRFSLQQTLVDLRNDRIIQEQLTDAVIPTPVMLANESGAYVYQDKNIIATVSKRLNGNHPSDKTLEIARSTGELLARFHQAVTVLDHSTQGYLNRDRALSDSKQLDEANPLTSQIRQMLNDNLEIFDSGLPKGIIHGDLHTGNALYEGETAKVILDFGDSEENLLLVDVVRTICSKVGVKDGRIDPALMRSVLEGYESIRPLTDKERQSIPMATRYVCAAVAIGAHREGVFDREEFFIKLAQQT